MLGRKRRTGTKQTKKITILNDVSSLFVLSQCVSCIPTWQFLHHVTVSCKGSIIQSRNRAICRIHNLKGFSFSMAKEGELRRVKVLAEVLGEYTPTFHYSGSLYFFQDELFLLVTDQGFLNEDQVIWESLANVEGDSYFVDAEFRSRPAAQSTAPRQPTAHLSPMNQQLSLEDQE